MDDEAAKTFEEVLEECRGEKDGEIVVARLVRFYRDQSTHNQNRLNDVMNEWIQSGNIIKANLAIALISRLKIKSALPRLIEKQREIREGKSNLPQYFDQFLSPAIEKLSNTTKVPPK